MRLQPLRVFGAWAGMPGLPKQALPVDDEEPVGVLTLGRLRLPGTAAFRRSAGPAEAAAIDSPALLAGTGLARPPRLVATFSLWRSAAEMREYAAAPAAPTAPRSRPTGPSPSTTNRPSSASALTPPSGSWDGRDPLAGLERRDRLGSSPEPGRD